MAFKPIFETADQERQRLVDEGEHNPRLAELAKLPVRVPHPDETTIIVLPPGTWRGDSRIVVIPVRRHGVRKDKNSDDLYLRNGHWHCRVIGGNDPVYRPGGYDIVVMEEELRRGRQIVIDEALLNNLEG